MRENRFDDEGFLDGEFPLRIAEKRAKPEEFLNLFEKTEYYDCARRFVRRVDNDTGIPFLMEKEYAAARKVIPPELSKLFEKRTVSKHGDKVYLRGEAYYLDLNERLENLRGEPFSRSTLKLLGESIEDDLTFVSLLLESSEKASTLEEKMLIGSSFDLLRNHSLILFAGLYESMKANDSIRVTHYNSVREILGGTIDAYYRFMIEGELPERFLKESNVESVQKVMGETLSLIKDSIAIETSQLSKGSGVRKIFGEPEFLAREFDHPGRMILYASQLLSRVQEKGKEYGLLVNLLNGSAEMGLAVQTIDNLLNAGCITGTTIIDFARYTLYSFEDRKPEETPSYREFAEIAIPKKLRYSFREKVVDKDILVIDDNLLTGQTLFDVKTALQEIAGSVDISVAEVAPIQIAIKKITGLPSLDEIREELEELVETGEVSVGDVQRIVALLQHPGKDPHFGVKLIEASLTYPPIGWSRGKPKTRAKRIKDIISLDQKTF